MVTSIFPQKPLVSLPTYGVVAELADAVHELGVRSKALAAIVPEFCIDRVTLEVLPTPAFVSPPKSSIAVHVLLFEVMVVLAVDRQVVVPPFPSVSSSVPLAAVLPVVF